MVRLNMYEQFHNLEIYQNDYSFQHTQQTFMALVDIIIPQTPGLAVEYGKIQYFGAIDLDINEYMILSLNNNTIPLAEPTAQMLDIAAKQLVSRGGNQEALDFTKFPGGGIFAALAPDDRFRALILLEQLDINLEDLPIPYQNNPGLVLSVTSSFNRLTLMGYYSEWSGYGSTRLASPNYRKLEYFPLSWQQVGYPGPSLGYRALRKV